MSNLREILKALLSSADAVTPPDGSDSTPTSYVMVMDAVAYEEALEKVNQEPVEQVVTVEADGSILVNGGTLVFGDSEGDSSFNKGGPGSIKVSPSC